jgi:transcriptional regulator with XRE-family HTH domain
MRMASRRVRLARCRKAAGLTQETLAHLLKVQRSTVVRWESGEIEPGAWVRGRLARALKISAAELEDLLVAPSASVAPTIERRPSGSVLHEPARRAGVQPQHWVADDVNRRELLRLLTLAGALMAMPTITASLDIDRIADTADRPELFDATTLDEYAELNGHLWRVFALSASKADALPAVRTQLAVLAQNLQRPHGEAVHQRLCGFVADLLQLAGEIFFDGNFYTDAAHCYSLAASASKEASAYDLWACAMTRHAFIAIYEGQFTQASPMLELAASLASHGDGALSTRHWVNVVQAETFAGLGELSKCQRALDNAEQVRHIDGIVHNGGWLRFDGSRLAEERGTCYLTLGRPDLAETALTSALHEDLTPRRRASVLTDLAVVGAHRRSLDQVITYADAAITEARNTGSGVIGHKLAGLQPYLTPMLGNIQIQRINTEITALTAQSPA